LSFSWYNRTPMKIEVLTTKIQVVDEYYTTATREADEDDSWDRGNTDTTHYIKGMEIVTAPNQSVDLEVPFKIVPDKSYYLIYALYTTGDTFGSDTGNIEYIGLYKTYKECQVNETRIYAHQRGPDPTIKVKSKAKKDKYSEYSVELISPSGQPYMVGCPWNGYFNGLESIVIEGVYLIENNK
jgi:hypothetical protein